MESTTHVSNISTHFQVGVSLAADEWLYGPFLCHISTYIETVLSAADILLICALNIAKLTVILKPFAARQWSNKAAYVIVGLIWAGANVYPVLESVYREVYFDYRSYRCTFLHQAGVWAWSDPIFIVLVMALPTLTIIISSICLVCYVNRVSGIHKEAVFTSTWISAIFFVAYTPMCTYVLGEKWILHDSDPADLATDPLYKNLFRWGQFTRFINSVANPFIYYVTIVSFKCYVRGLFTKDSHLKKRGKVKLQTAKQNFT